METAEGSMKYIALLNAAVFGFCALAYIQTGRPESLVNALLNLVLALMLVGLKERK